MSEKTKVVFCNRVSNTLGIIKPIKKLLKIEGVKIYETTAEKTAVISFNVGEIHPYDIGVILDKL